MAKPIDPGEQTGKTRAARIPLDYHRNRSPIDRWRFRAAILGIACVSLYLGFIMVTPGGLTHLSTGRLSAAHASIETNCSACHVDFVPIAADAWRFDPDTSIGLTAERCLACHSNVRPHGETLSMAGKRIDQNCASCHAEHRGRSHQLVPIADRSCTDCHAEPVTYLDVANGDARSPREITEFTSEKHGEFPSLGGSSDEQADRVIFDHAVHMMPGQVLAGYRGGTRLGQLSGEHRSRYDRGGQDHDETLVQLRCIDCHQFESSVAGRGRSGDLGWGRNALPVRYDQHCVACHPIGFPGQQESQWGVPHAVPMDRLRQSVQGRLATLELIESVPGPRPSSVSTPGTRSAGRAADPTSADATSAAGSLPLRVDRAIGEIREQCRKCHGQADLDQIDPASVTAGPRLRSGRFDHASHHQMVCVACHPGADRQGQTLSPSDRQAWSMWLSTVASGSATAQDVESQRSSLPMTIGISSCTPCHRETSFARPSGTGAPVDRDNHSEMFRGLSDVAPTRCVTCHRYHPDVRADLTDATHHPAPQVDRADNGIDRLAWVHFRPVGDRVWDRENVRVTGTDSLLSASSSCASSTCHGGPIRQQPDWNSSQTVFDAYDPHRRAGWTLQSSWSRQIVTSLDPGSATSPERFRGLVLARCSGCHVPGDQADSGAWIADESSSGQSTRLATAQGVSTPLHTSFGSDGVSCAACHGPTDGWLQDHVRENWVAKGSMRETRQYIDRITGCVRCHVGSRTSDGMIRDMNHDMIAAGHPTLRFDPWSAMSRLPAHGEWSRDRDGLPELQGEAALRRYLIGRVVALKAAIKLSAERLSDTRPDAHSKAVWPELSDFDCFACHHRLRITNFAVRPSQGHPEPFPWYQRGLIDQGLQHLSAVDAAALRRELETFQGRLATPRQLEGAAGRSQVILDRFLSWLTDARSLPEQMVQWRFPQRARGHHWDDWYHAAEWYLSSHARLADHPQGFDDKKVVTAFERLADRLGFQPADIQSPFALDSPEGFEIDTFIEAARPLLPLISR